MTKKVQSKKKKKIIVNKAVVHIHATFNNTIITITDIKGNVLLWKSAGSVGYKGTRKSTPYAAQKAAESCISDLKNFQTTEVDIMWNKTGPGKDSAIRAFQSSDINVLTIIDATKRSHSVSTKKIKKRH